jgi:hypothetical protein
VLTGSRDVHGASRRELGKRSLPVTETASSFLNPPSGWMDHRASSSVGQVVRDGPPRSPHSALRLLTVPVGHRSLPRLSLTMFATNRASLATDHSGCAGALRTASARSGQTCMYPRRQRVSARGCATQLLTLTGKLLTGGVIALFTRQLFSTVDLDERAGT